MTLTMKRILGKANVWRLLAQRASKLLMATCPLCLCKGHSQSQWAGAYYFRTLGLKTIWRRLQVAWKSLAFSFKTKFLVNVRDKFYSSLFTSTLSHDTFVFVIVFVFVFVFAVVFVLVFVFLFGFVFVCVFSLLCLPPAGLLKLL